MLGFGGVLVQKDDTHTFDLLQSVEDLKASPAAIAAQYFGRIRDVLELIENEARNCKDRPKKSGLGHVGDASIYDNAGIQQHRVRILRPAALREKRQLGQIPAFFTYIGESKKIQDLTMAQNHHRYAQIAHNYDADKWQNSTERIGQERQRIGQERGDGQPDRHADGGCHELHRGNLSQT